MDDVVVGDDDDDDDGEWKIDWRRRSPVSTRLPKLYNTQTKSMYYRIS